MEEVENVKYRLVLPKGLSESDACDFMNELQQSDINGMGDVSFENALEDDNTMGGAWENVLGFLGKMFTFEPLLEFILKLVHPIDFTIEVNIDGKGCQTAVFKGKGSTKRALKELNKQYEDFLKITNANRPQLDVEFKISHITGEDGKSVSTFDAQGLTSHAASKANELYREYLENSQLDIVVSSK